jgi:DNA-binding transcriptional MerR regulator
MKEMYSPRQVQERLGMDQNNLRKYATLLEGHGYHIHRNHRGHRGYSDKDVSTLRQLMDLNKQKGMNLDQAVQDILALVTEDEKELNETPPTVCNHDDLLERILHLEQLNVDLLKLLKDKAVREAYLEEKVNLILKYVERTSEQIESEQFLKIEEETRKQLAAATEKSWWKWWK